MRHARCRLGKAATEVKLRQGPRLGVDAQKRRLSLQYRSEQPRAATRMLRKTTPLSLPAESLGRSYNAIRAKGHC